METYQLCPICDSKNLKPYLEVKDYFLTQELFKLQKCEECELVFTNPYPSKSDLSKYYQSDNYYSHPNKKKSLLSVFYEAVKVWNLKYKLHLATSGFDKGKILDIGCGAGDFLLLAKNSGWEIEGIEPNEEARNHSTTILNKRVFSIHEFDLFSDSSFDVITMWHVLEHVEDLHQQCRELHRLLKPDGRLVIALPNITSYDALHYGKFWAGWDVPRHLFHFNFVSIQGLLKRHEFLFLKREPLKWDAFYISMLSEKYINNRIMPLKTIVNGWKSNFKAKKTKEFSSNIYIFGKSRP